MKHNTIFSRALSLTLVLAMVLTLAACSRTAGPRAERILKMDFSGNTGFPAMYTTASNGPGYVMMSYMFDTLVWKDDKGEVNLLADSYSVSDDQLTYTFKLRENVTFHDGTPFTAEDVKFTFDYTSLHPYQWTATTMVKEVRVVDDLTVEIELKKAYVPFITDVAGNLPMLPKHIYENVSDPTLFTDKEALIGTGPLMLESYDPDTSVYILVKNPNYYYGEVQIDKLVLAPHSDSKEALLAGEIDAAAGMKYVTAASLKDTENMTFIEGQSIQVARLHLNFADEALAVKEIRQAISYAIDRQSIVDKAMKGSAIVGTAGFVHPDSPWYNPDVAVYSYDVDKAKELMASVGAVDTNGDGIAEYKGKKLAYEFLVGDKDVKVCEMIVSYLQAIGIGCTAKTADDSTVKGNISEGKFDIAFNRHGTFGGDPKYMACLATDTAGAIKVSIPGGKRWQSKEFDELFYASLQEQDKAARKELIAKCQEIVAEELPTLAIYFPVNAAVYNNTVFDGFYFTADGIASGIPFIYNKLCLITGEWKGK